MANDIKQALEQIIAVSRQLLSCILAVQNKIQGAVGVTQESVSETDNNSHGDKEITMAELTELLAKRDGLIRHLFTQYLSIEIAQEQDLLNEMATLDKQLSDNLQLCKQTLAAQVIKLKKGNKATKSYQKY
ncbi:hypothetical protein CMT41_05670 [Colwellia sp. MT41]|uniref:Flagellar protein FliT n=1 Tax=Colwellia marinimaniae TaxID=1513592 RepID=A0ABQ0MVD3_9GAMM|nr:MULTISPECIES: hypothetical protein [Colwellia]ALO34274.1 hypothetical protein CMT41_05670 [Colwellia sp. MT41]GAW96287.1 hypothetical protein MTCD1_01901 [Colwellia marinimaniae]